MNFKNLFKSSGKKEGKEPSAGEAITRLRDLEQMLETKQQYLEQKIENELKTARQCSKTNKRLALQSLKRKKRYEKQLQQIDGTLSSIEMQREALEGVHTNATVLRTMKFAADALKKTHETIDVDKVHDMIDDISEQQDIAREITDAISNPTAFSGYDIDDDDLERELEELAQQELDKELLEADDLTTTELPSVPNEATPRTRPRTERDQEDDELSKLQQWAT